MRVKDLIEALQEFPPEAEIVPYNEDFTHTNLFRSPDEVEEFGNDAPVYIELYEED